MEDSDNYIEIIKRCGFAHIWYEVKFVSDTINICHSQKISGGSVFNNLSYMFMNKLSKQPFRFSALNYNNEYVNYKENDIHTTLKRGHPVVSYDCKVKFGDIKSVTVSIKGYVDKELWEGVILGFFDVSFDELVKSD